MFKLNPKNVSDVLKISTVLVCGPSWVFYVVSKALSDLRRLRVSLIDGDSGAKTFRRTKTRPEASVINLCSSVELMSNEMT